MVQIISCSKSTILHDFTTLNSLSVHEHEDNEKNDFQFFSSAKLFLKTNRKNEVEFLRIKSSETKNEGKWLPFNTVTVNQYHIYSPIYIFN